MPKQLAVPVGACALLDDSLTVPSCILIPVSNLPVNGVGSALTSQGTWPLTSVAERHSDAPASCRMAGLFRGISSSAPRGDHALQNQLSASSGSSEQVTAVCLPAKALPSPGRQSERRLSASPRRSEEHRHGH